MIFGDYMRRVMRNLASVFPTGSDTNGFYGHRMAKCSKVQVVLGTVLFIHM